MTVDYFSSSSTFGLPLLRLLISSSSTNNRAHLTTHRRRRLCSFLRYSSIDGLSLLAGRRRCYCCSSSVAALAMRMKFGSSVSRLRRLSIRRCCSFPAQSVRQGCSYIRCVGIHTFPLSKLSTSTQPTDQPRMHQKGGEEDADDDAAVEAGMDGRTDGWTKNKNRVDVNDSTHRRSSE